MRRRLQLLLWMLIAGLLAAPRAAQATAHSVSFLGVSGPGGERLSDLVEQDLAELYELVAGEVYRRTADRMGKTGPTPAEVQAVCVALRIDALVAGAVGGVGPERQLVIVVREGASGLVVARKRYVLAGRALPALRELVLGDLVRALERVRRIPPRGTAISEALPVPEADDTNPAGAVEPTTSLVQAPKPIERRPHRGFSAGVGPSLLTRRQRYDVSAAPGYAGGTVGAIRVEGAIFPIALSAELAEAHPVLASFGLVGGYERAFDFATRTDAGTSAGHASRWHALLVGRIPLGHARRGGVLTIESGFQRLTWGLSDPLELGIPDVVYSLVDVGLGYERELGTPYLLLALRLAAEGLVDAGPASDPNAYGPAQGWGLDAELGLTARPARWLWIKLAARYTPLFVGFGGAGARPAQSSTDQYAGGALEVGFAL